MDHGGEGTLGFPNWNTYLLPTYSLLFKQFHFPDPSSQHTPIKRCYLRAQNLLNSLLTTNITSPLLQQLLINPIINVQRRRLHATHLPPPPRRNPLVTIRPLHRHNGPSPPPLRLRPYPLNSPHNLRPRETNRPPKAGQSVHLPAASRSADLGDLPVHSHFARSRIRVRSSENGSRNPNHPPYRRMVLRRLRGPLHIRDPLPPGFARA